ncbi:hypothetical protein HAX54_019215, partial [Datura stramonium]|nr:hypothetical protein [Datura stramonium]
MSLVTTDATYESYHDDMNGTEESSEEDQRIVQGRFGDHETQYKLWQGLMNH